jgi:rhodanese-related sulfurtransferase
MNPTRISPQEARDKLAEGYTYVDVRTSEEFQAGHPPGAVNVPVMLAGAGGMTPNPEFAAVMKAAFLKDAKIVVGCKAGGRSLRAAQILLADGFTDVLDQRAGWDGARGPFGDIAEPGWARAGLPTEEGQPAGRSWDDMRVTSRAPGRPLP